MLRNPRTLINQLRVGLTYNRKLSPNESFFYIDSASQSPVCVVSTNSVHYGDSRGLTSCPFTFPCLEVSHISGWRGYTPPVPYYLIDPSIPDHTCKNSSRLLGSYPYFLSWYNLDGDKSLPSYYPHYSNVISNHGIEYINSFAKGVNLYI